MDVIRELVGVKGWLVNVWERKRISSRGMYIRSTSDIRPKGKDIRSIADIPPLYKIEAIKWICHAKI
ncbi:MAG: hypothetical protein U9N41_08975 [Euryarchaeota archaeon]|nr:hypothetical protein [Euryarchaeota archaeon]